MIYADEVLNNGSSSKKTFTITDITRGTLTGASIGLVGGTLYAYFRDKKYINCMIIGTVAGGFISRIFLIQK